MKLIAKKDFANVKSLGLKDLKIPTHIPKGTRFSVGTTEIWDDLTEAEKRTVAQLVTSKSVVEDNDANKAVVAKIDAEVKAEAVAAAQAVKAPTMPELVASAVAGALAEAGLIKSK